MNRKIKFRAWDKDEQKMLNPPVEFLTLLRQISYRNDNSVGGDAVRRHTLEWMQFTGLKDKNGVEIYEGDVMTGNKIYHSEWVTQSVVEFQSGYFGVTDMAGGDCWALCDFEGSVIGNIYENPELVIA
jgi:uncharacterized phage protein (TIGR01671 family)